MKEEIIIAGFGGQGVLSMRNRERRENLLAHPEQV